jgi:hypothetical protein
MADWRPTPFIDGSSESFKQHAGAIREWTLVYGKDLLILNF